MTEREMDVTTLYQQDWLDITLDSDNQWLYLNWKGYHSDQLVRAGVNQAINLMVQQQTYKVLNDNTHAVGIWIGSAAWLVLDALPRAKQAGLQAFAHVFGSSRFSRISAEAALSLLNRRTPHIETFEAIDAAQDWLRSQKAHVPDHDKSLR